MLAVTKNLAELCTLVIDDVYGELPSRIFAALINHGRSTVSQLARYTFLTPRQLRHGLAVLLQYDLLYFQVNAADGTTVYDANPEAAYNVVRSGKVLEIVESLYGADAKDVVQNLLALGHTRIADLKDAYTAKIVKWEASLRECNGDKEVANGNGNENRAAVNGDEVSEHDSSHAAHPAREDTAIRSMSHLNAVVSQLVVAEVVEVVTPLSFQSFPDRLDQARDYIKRTYFPDEIHGQKKKDEFESRLADHLQSLRDEPRKLKRTLQANGGGRQKLRKLANGSDVANGHDEGDHDPLLDAKTILRVNYERCAVLLRNQRLVQAAAEAIGETTSQVYAVLLRQLTETIPRCRADPMMDTAGSSDFLRQRLIGTWDVFDHLSPSVDVFTGIGKVAANEIDVPTSERLERHAKVDAFITGGDGYGSGEDDDGGGGGGIDGDDDEDYDSEGEVQITTVIRQPAAAAAAAAANGSSEQNGSGGQNGGQNGSQNGGPRVKFADGVAGGRGGNSVPATPAAGIQETRLQQMRQHLLLLCDHRLRFLRHCDRGQWTVDFVPLLRRLREAELDGAIGRQAGRQGLRLARILRDKGKLDEKTLPALALMKKSDVQHKMLELQAHGFVEMQEVPRDNNRSASRSLFLWYCDTARAEDMLLDNAYKAMVRCLRVRDVHRRASREVLAFVQRPDVKGREREALEKKYFDRYQRYCDIEAKLAGQVMRLDSLVATLRDF